MRILCYLLLLAIVTSTIACAPRITAADITRALDSFKGHTKDDLIKTKGIPHQEYKLTDGSCIVQYVYSSTSQGIGAYYPLGTSGIGAYVPPPTKSSVYYLDFTVSPQNIVTGWNLHY